MRETQQQTIAPLAWEDQFGITGPGMRYDVFGGSVAQLRASWFAAGRCLTPQSLAAAKLIDPPLPAPGDARYYVVRAQNQVNVTTCGSPERDAGIAASPSPCTVLFPQPLDRRSSQACRPGREGRDDARWWSSKI